LPFVYWQDHNLEAIPQTPSHGVDRCRTRACSTSPRQKAA
jgi:hypothetical protein